MKDVIYETYNKGISKVVTDPSSGREVKVYKEFPGGLLVYYPHPDIENKSILYILDIDRNGVMTVGSNEELWGSPEGKRVMAYFNSKYNTSYWGWYNLKDIIDMDSRVFDKESVEFTISNTEGRAKGKSYKDLNSPGIDVVITVDGKQADLREVGYYSKSLHSGYRSVTQASRLRDWTDTVINYLKEKDLLVLSEDDSEITDFGVSYEFVIKSAVRMIQDNDKDFGIEDLVVDYDGDNVILTRTNNPVYKVIMNTSSGESMFINKRGAIFPDENPEGLAWSLHQLSNNTDELYSKIKYWKLQLTAVKTLSDSLKELRTMDDPTSILDKLVTMSTTANRAKIRLKSSESHKTNLDSLYLAVREYVTEISSRITTENAGTLVNSASSTRSLSNNIDSLLDQLRILYSRILGGGKVG